MDNDAIYYSRRAQEQREAALKAGDAKAQKIHLQLAEAYQQRVHEIMDQGRRSSSDRATAA
jgi:hypothetical protein